MLHTTRFFICVGFSVDRVGFSANTYKEPICRGIIAKSSAALRDKTAHLAAVVSCLLIQNYEIVLDYFSLCPSCINNQRVTNFRFNVQISHNMFKKCTGTLRCFECNSGDDNCGNFNESSTGSWVTCSESAFCITQSFRFYDEDPLGTSYTTHECSETAGLLGLDTGG